MDELRKYKALCAVFTMSDAIQLKNPKHDPRTRVLCDSLEPAYRCSESNKAIHHMDTCEFCKSYIYSCNNCYWNVKDYECVNNAPTITEPLMRCYTGSCAYCRDYIFICNKCILAYARDKKRNIILEVRCGACLNTYHGNELRDAKCSKCEFSIKVCSCGKLNPMCFDCHRAGGNEHLYRLSDSGE
jgi:hypothetical protein